MNKGRIAPWRRSSLEESDISSKDYEDKERTKHIAELLEIMGASNINTAVKLQVDIMKAQKMSKVSSLIKDAKRAAALEEQNGDVRPAATQGGLAAALAATKLKARAAKVA